MTENTTKILLPRNVNSHVLDFLIDVTSDSYRQDKNAFHNIVLDLSQINYIEIEGVLSLICVCAAIKRKNPNTNFRIIYPKERVLTYLMTLGFFGQMTNKVEILEGQEIIHIENKWRKERKTMQIARAKRSDPGPVVLPIETINQRMQSTTIFDFENMVGKFANNAMETLDILRTSALYNFSGEDYYRFRQSNIELYKNVFHHSRSWGIASIHARPDVGTTVCYYDIGIGFKESVKRFNTEAESIEWALVDGNTSKLEEDNDGYGFTLIQEFVFQRKGSIKIRSGDCLLQLNSNTSREKKKVKKFPGVQISYLIPA